MRNDHLPILQALKGKSKPKGETALPSFDMPRSFEIQHHEIPGLPGRKVGEPITVSLKGHIHSQSNDGHAVMHVAEVKPDSDAMIKKENPEEPVHSKSGAVSGESHA